jgi:hypothetical protein
MSNIERPNGENLNRRARRVAEVEGWIMWDRQAAKEEKVRWGDGGKS